MGGGFQSAIASFFPSLISPQKVDFKSCGINKPRINFQAHTTTAKGWPLLVSAFYLLVCLFASRLYRTVELGLFRPINCCSHSMESPYTAVIVRIRRRTATNTGPTGRAVTPASPDDRPIPRSPLFRSPL